MSDPDNEANYYHKSILISDAQSLASQNYSTYKEWSDTRDQMSAIIADWKMTGSVNCRESRQLHDNPNQALGEEFHEALTEYFAAGDALREELKELHQERESAKLDLIGQAQDLLELDDPREANTNFHALIEEWKSIGYCGETNDDLWNQLHEVGQTIKENVRSFYEARDTSAIAKKALISELTSQLASAKGADRLKLVKDAEKRWSALGHAGRSEKSLRVELDLIAQPIRSEAKMLFEQRQRASEMKIEFIRTLSERSSNGHKFSGSERTDAIKKWKSIGHAGRDEETLWSKLLEALGG